ncbi:hypothetical protein AB838_08465 [Rhodobacteraceae bacterium (ex Bugula neritina AB1)]|nr:hypothetical protein AB838_08465 [Rhodobacteraceae bacterium (ex Bugula neritina AB1)]
MMFIPLSMGQLLDYGARAFGYQEIVSYDADHRAERMSFAHFRDRCLRQAAYMRQALKVEKGERVATLAWTNRRHLELYFSVPGLGAVLHTINPRYSDEQIVYILNHAENRIALVDPSQRARVERLAAQCPRLEQIITLDADWDAQSSATAPLTEWVEVPETSGSSMCYTSGTTGEPKGVVYSHRSTMLYTLAGLATGKLALGTQASALMCVPMFHVNGWSKPFQAMLSGSKIVLPGPNMDGESLLRVIDAEGVTCGFGVPTIWLGLVEQMRAQGRGPGSLRNIGFGGGAVPRSLLQALIDEFGIQPETGYGMTETTAGLALGSDGPDFDAGSPDDRLDLYAAQRPIFGMDLKVEDDAGQEVPRDGQSTGELTLKGHLVIGSYFRNPDANAVAFTPQGRFRTGDVVSIDTHGRVRVQDRLKDIIKSGGEWINSAVLERECNAHPGVIESAAIGLPHAKWSERPLLVVRKQPEAALSEADLRAFVKPRVQSWWCPDAIVFVDDLPKTATGKIDKKTLRAQLKGWEYDPSGVLLRPGD